MDMTTKSAGQTKLESRIASAKAKISDAGPNLPEGFVLDSPWIRRPHFGIGDEGQMRTFSYAGQGGRVERVIGSGLMSIFSGGFRGMARDGDWENAVTLLNR